MTPPLALAKRRDDVAKGLGGDHRASLSGYSSRFLDTAIAIVLGALVVSYIIYTTDIENQHRFGTDQLFVTTPFVIAAVLRYLQITIVEERSGARPDAGVTGRNDDAASDTDPGPGGTAAAGAAEVTPQSRRWRNWQTH